MPPSHLAFALDVADLSQAQALLSSLQGLIGYAKVGLELFCKEGPPALRLPQSLGIQVFADLKLHDIPQTVENAVASVCASGAKLLTVHIAGGPAMLERALARAQKENTGLQLVGVTVLTSLGPLDLVQTGISQPPEAQVLSLARLGFASGLRAFVCSPQEVGAVRAALGPEPLLITPGIRPGGSALQDQKRTATPRAAIASGASLLVVGRPIAQAQDPRSAALAIVQEIDAALSCPLPQPPQPV